MFGRLFGCLFAVFAACTAHAGASSKDAPGPPSEVLGNPERGRAAVADREGGNCLLCHQAPLPGERFQGNLGPSLEGVGARLTREDIRARIIDASQVNPATIMPPYYRTEGLTRVAAAYAGKTVLSAGTIEDIVAYLATLKD